MQCWPSQATRQIEEYGVLGEHIPPWKSQESVTTF